jgi:hypothetical protein
MISRQGRSMDSTGHRGGPEYLPHDSLARTRGTNCFFGLVPIVPGKLTGLAGFLQTYHHVACEAGHGRVKVVGV